MTKTAMNLVGRGASDPDAIGDFCTKERDRLILRLRQQVASGLTPEACIRCALCYWTLYTIAQHDALPEITRHIDAVSAQEAEGPTVEAM